MTAEEIIALKKDPAASTEFAVIDVRRGDHGVCILLLATRALIFLKLEPFRLKGGHIRGSDNWAAQTFYDDLPAFYEKYKDTTRVIFYCSKSNGRGPRCAGWYVFHMVYLEYVIDAFKIHRYQDYLDSREDHKSTAYLLKGGVKNWLAQYGDNDGLVDRD